MAAEGLKRPAENGGGELVAVAKKPRTDDGSKALAPSGPKRTSNLEAPIMLLSGHGGEVFSCRFNPDGDVLASGSHDKSIYLWRVFEKECPNYMLLKGHKNAVLEVHWTTDGERILSASPDKSVRAWDARTGEQVKKMAEHDNFVNSCCPLKRGPPLLCSGADDGNVKVWDLRVKRSVQTFEGKYQVLAVAFAEAGDQVYAGGLDNKIRVWDLRRGEASMELGGHTDSVTGMRISPDGTHLLTNSADNTLRIWDMQPFAPAERCTEIFVGHQHGFDRNLLRCDWSPDGGKVAAGSADQFVYIWRVGTRGIDYKLPGHRGSVNEAVFHPKEPIIASASSDKGIYLGELSKWS